MTTGSAVRRAREIVTEFGFDDPPIPVEEVAGRLGLVVLRQDLPPDTSAVIIRTADGRKVIGLNSAHHPLRQRFSIAHEIGHALLHLPPTPPRSGDAVVDKPLEILFRDNVASMGVDQREIEANRFAAELLMPEAAVRQQFRDLLLSPPYRDVDGLADELANKFVVSSQAMRFRLNNLGLIDPT